MLKCVCGFFGVFYLFGYRGCVCVSVVVVVVVVVVFG